MSPFKDLTRIVNGVSLVAREATKRSEAFTAARNGDLETLVSKTLKAALVSATDLVGFTRGTPREISNPRPKESVVYFSDPDPESRTEPTVSRPDPIEESIPASSQVPAREEEAKEIVAENLKAVHEDLRGLSTKIDEKDANLANSNEKSDIGSDRGSEQRVVPPKRRRPRERRVPSTPLTRFMGFAGLGAGLAWGTVQESAKRIVYGTPTTTDGSQSALSPLLSEQNAERLALALCRMRGAALKLGQMLSIQDESLVPAPILAALEIVRQGADVMPRSQLNDVLDAELGPDWSSKLRSFDYEPLAAASIGQVIEGFPRLNERASQKLAEARANFQPSPLFLRPSSQWYAHNNQPETTQTENPELLEAVRDEFGIYHVCYSMHSSRDELEWALQLLKPKWVISTTPPCRAMELDYVKKYCYKTRIAADDPLWKLFGVSKGKSVSLSSAIASEAENVTVSSIVEDSTISVASDHLRLEEVSAKHSEIKIELSALSGSRNVTLFGRARFGIPDIELLQDKKSEPADVENNRIITDLKKSICIKSFRSPESAEHSIEKSIEANNFDKEISYAGLSRTSVCDYTSTNPVKVVDAEGEFSCMGSSKDLNISLKKLYRSMNVPVPRPLPSLVELLSTSKRVKLRSESISDRLEYCYSSSYSLHEHVDF